MNAFLTAAQIVLGLGILNVWLLRSSKPTAWRGGSAASMKEEFAVYGLPGWVMAVVGFLKISCAVALLVGLYMPALVSPAALLLGLLMLAAVTMHLKVRDPIKKSSPALAMLALCIVVAFA
jgi:hypothetical protein